MAVQTETSRVIYAGNNSTVTPYPVPFKFFSDADLKLSVLTSGGATSLLVLGTDYTVTGAGSDLGGDIVTTAAIPSTSTVTIAREIPATQLYEFEEADRFPARSFEDGLDKVTMLAQQQGRNVEDSFRAIPAQGPIDPLQLAPNSIIGTQPTTNQLRLFSGAQLQALLNLPGTVIDQPTKTFANASERSIAAPDFLGQIGVQLDTNNVYVGQSISAGGWLQYSIMGAIDINGLTAETTVDVANDFAPMYDASASLNRKVKISDLVKNATAATVTDGGITTAKIADANVTTAKIADANVTTAKIAGANVTTAKIADANVTAAKLSGAQSGGAPVYGCRAWILFHFNPNAVLLASGHVSSVTTTGVNHRVNFTSPMQSTNYAAAVTGGINFSDTAYAWGAVLARTVNYVDVVFLNTLNGGSSSQRNASVLIFE